MSASLPSPIPSSPAPSSPAPFAHDVLQGADYAWAKPGHLPSLVGRGGAVEGAVEGVHMPAPARGGIGGMLDRARGALAPEAPGLDIPELSRKLAEASAEVRALDHAANGATRTSPEGWRLGHPETQARWESLQRGYSNGALRDMRIEVDAGAGNGADTGLDAHGRAVSLRLGS